MLTSTIHIFEFLVDLDFVSVHKIVIRTWPVYPVILTEQAWPIKDLLYGQKKMFSCVIKAGNPD